MDTAHDDDDVHWQIEHVYSDDFEQIERKKHMFYLASSHHIIAYHMHHGWLRAFLMGRESRAIARSTENSPCSAHTFINPKGFIFSIS